MATQIQIRRDTAANWTSANPVLAAGEIGFETDTGEFKIGTGTVDWATLPYAGGGGGAIGPDLTDINSITTEAGQTMTITSDGLEMLLKVDNADHTILGKNPDSTAKITTGYVHSTNPAFPLAGGGHGNPVEMNTLDANGFTFNAGDTELGNVTNLADGATARIMYPAQGSGNNVLRFVGANTNIKFGTMSGSTATPFDGTFGGGAGDYNPTPASVLVIEVTGYDGNAYVTSWTSTAT